MALVLSPSSPPFAGFSPHEVHAHSAFFGWIMPTLKTSEYTILQIVGLDAAVVSLSPGPQSQPLRLSSAATRVLQDVFLSIFFMLSFCHRSFNAYQLDGTCISVNRSGGVLTQLLLLTQRGGWARPGVHEWGEKGGVAGESLSSWQWWWCRHARVPITVVVPMPSQRHGWGRCCCRYVVGNKLCIYIKKKNNLL